MNNVLFNALSGSGENGLPSGGTDGQILTRRTAGDAWESQRQGAGLYIYADDEYDVTPLSVLGNSTFVDIPNNGAGPLSADFILDGVPLIWDVSTQHFYFNDIEPGGKVALRIDMDITTSIPNQQVDIRFFGGIGSPLPFVVSFISGSWKSTGAHLINRYTPIFASNTDTKEFPGVLRISSDGALTVGKIRFFCDVTKYYGVT